jgi:curved DNA-binding protein
MEYKDYYKAQGVNREASAAEIKRAYQKLARKFHPDVNKEKNSEERFKEVNQAYHSLKDPKKRKAYDQLAANWQQGQTFQPPPDWTFERRCVMHVCVVRIFTPLFISVWKMLLMVLNIH